MGVITVLLAGIFLELFVVTHVAWGILRNTALLYDRLGDGR